MRDENVGLRWERARLRVVAAREALRIAVIEFDEAHRALCSYSAELTTFNLTPTERIVFRHVVAGKANKEIAAEIGRTERTVKFHVTSILKKCHVQNRYSLQASLAGVA